MKKSLKTFSPLVIGLFVLTLFGCAPQQNTNSPANVSMATATPDKTAIEAELTRIENDWPRVIRERDVAAVQRVEADDVALIYPDGSIGGKEQDLKDIGSGALSADSWDISEVRVNVLDADCAVVTLRSTVTNGKYKMADGKTQDISGQYRSVDTFARRNGQWQLVGSATTPARAPSASPAPSMMASPRETPEKKPSPAMKASPSMKASPAMKSAPPASTP